LSKEELRKIHANFGASKDENINYFELSKALGLHKESYNFMHGGKDSKFLEKLSKKRADHSVILSSRKSLAPLDDLSPMKIKPQEGAITSRIQVAKTIRFNEESSRPQLIKMQQSRQEKAREAESLLKTMDVEKNGQIPAEKFLKVLKVYGLKAPETLGVETVNYKQELQNVI